LIDQLSSLECSFHQYGESRVERFNPFRHAPQVFGTPVDVALAGSATFSFVSHEDTGFGIQIVRLAGSKQPSIEVDAYPSRSNSW
jgi:hypothetical protein